MWTHPRDRSSDYTSLDHRVRLARMLARGLFDGLFLADVLGAYEVYGGNADASPRAGAQIPPLDPMALGHRQLGGACQGCANRSG